MNKSVYVLIFSLFLLFGSPINAAENNIQESVLRDQAYKTIDAALFDEKVHPNMKIDIFNLINELTTNKTEDQANSQIEGLFEDLIKNQYRTTVAIDLLDDSDEKSSNELSLNDSVDPNILNILRKALNDSDINMNLYALDVISKSGIRQLLPDVTKRLSDVGDDDTEMKSSLLLTLGDIGNDSTVSILSKYIDDPALRIRINAIQALSSINSGSVNEILKSKIKDGDLETALLSSGILLDSGNMDAFNLLKQGIQSPVETTRQKTLVAMTYTKSPKVIPLIKVVIDGGDDDLKPYALNILANIDSPEAVELIKTAVKSDNIMPRALVALGNNTSNEAVKLFQDIFKSDSFNRKVYALSVLSQSKNKKFIPVLRMALADNDESIRVTAAKILTILGDNSAIDVLKQALKSDNSRISLSSAAFLGYIGKNDGENILRKAIQDVELTSWQRLDYAIILERLGNPSIIPDLEQLLSNQRPSGLPRNLLPTESTLDKMIKDGSKWLKINTGYFLSRLNRLDCPQAILELSNDPDLTIRTNAIKLMGKFNSKGLLPVLKEHLSDKAVRVRVNSAESILKILSKESLSKDQPLSGKG